MVRTRRFHCRGPGFNSLVRELKSHKLCGMTKKQKREMGQKQGKGKVEFLVSLSIGEKENKA